MIEAKKVTTFLHIETTCFTVNNNGKNKASSLRKLVPVHILQFQSQICTMIGLDKNLNKHYWRNQN